MRKREYYETVGEGVRLEGEHSSGKKKRRKISTCLQQTDVYSNGSRLHSPLINGIVKVKSTQESTKLHKHAILALNGSSRRNDVQEHTTASNRKASHATWPKETQSTSPRGIQIVKNPLELPETLPGLNKRHRRKYRRRGKLFAMQNDQIEAKCETTTTQHQKNDIARRSDLVQNKQSPHSYTNAALKFQSLCSTNLMRKLVKRWDDRDRILKPFIEPTHDVGMADGFAIDESGPESRTSSDNDLDHKTTNRAAAPASAVPTLLTKNILCRQSYSAKAKSVPTFLDASDVKKAFARFNDYLQDQKSDDSDHSASDIEEGIDHNQLASTDTKGRYGKQIRTDIGESSHSQQNESGVDIIIVNDIMAPAVRSPETWQGDGGPHQIAEEVGPSDSVIDSGQVSQNEAASVSNLTHYDKAQQSQEDSRIEPTKTQPSKSPPPSSLPHIEGDSLFDTLQEISDSVFTLTAPLPSEHRPNSIDKDSPPSSSQGRMTRSATKALSHRTKGEPVTTTDLSIVPLPASEDLQAPEYSQDLRSANPTLDLTNAVKSPSPIVEITPTRPSYFPQNWGDINSGPAEETKSTQRRRTIASRLPTRSRKSRVDDIYAVPDDENESPPGKEGFVDKSIQFRSVSLPSKKKMTGSSSKHFSPTEPGARKSKVPAANSRATDEIIVEHHLDGGREDLSAMPEYRVIKIPDPSPRAIKVVQQPISTPNRAITRRYSASAAQIFATETIALDGSHIGTVQITINQADEATGIMEKVDSLSSPCADQKKAKRKGTGKTSEFFKPPKPVLDPNIIDRVDFYNTTGKKRRMPAGVSVAPIPPIQSERFGIIQEKLWREPFWLLIALTFLNVTTGRAAAPIFWKLKEQYPTPEALAEAPHHELYEMIYPLGLHTTRAKRVVSMAKAWIEQPPVKTRRYRTLHYPAKGDGKEYKTSQVIDEDADDCAGALEIGHMPGCKTYAYDSWRMFCRDVLRGVAEDYNGKGAVDGENFIPEWKKVLPEDKELRACMRWMWLREGWIWNHETGERRQATEEEMERAVKGEMDVPDAQEFKFAARAVAAELQPLEESIDCKAGTSSQEHDFSPSSKYEISPPANGGSRCRIF